MLTVHHLQRSQSERIVWLCEELDIPYTLKVYQRLPSMAAPPEYKALHPLGTAPTITDGALALAESGAIVEYIVHSYGGGRLILKPGDAGWLDYVFWYHFSNGSLVSALGRKAIARHGGLADDHPIAQAVSARVEALIDMVEQRLSEAAYFAGASFTAADIMNVYPLAAGSVDVAKRPAITRYLERIKARPARQRAMAKAEPGTS